MRLKSLLLACFLAALVGYSLFPGASRAADRPVAVSDEVAAGLAGGQICPFYQSPFVPWCDPNNYYTCGNKYDVDYGPPYKEKLVVSAPCSDKCALKYPSIVKTCLYSVVTY